MSGQPSPDARNSKRLLLLVMLGFIGLNLALILAVFLKKPANSSSSQTATNPAVMTR